MCFKLIVRKMLFIRDYQETEKLAEHDDITYFAFCLVLLPKPLPENHLIQEAFTTRMLQRDSKQT